jgi:transposase-like protein
VHDVVSCLPDAISLKLRAGRGAGRSVLVVATIALEGFMVLLGLQLGSRESDQRGPRTGPTNRRCVDHQSCVDL